MQDTLTTAAYQKALAYSHAHYVHYFLGVAYSVLLLYLLVRWHLGPRYRTWTRGRTLLYAPAILITLAILSLPFDVWDQSLDRRFGLSVQRWPSWGQDWLTNQLVTLVIETVLILIFYLIVRKSPRRWWVYVWLVSIPLIAAAFVAQPLIIDPLFYKFTPLATDHPELATAIEQVIHHGGVSIPPDRLYVMNASSKVTSLNAYVAGLGPSKRAVIWDTTIQQATPPQILFVFGHEMGHYVLHHIPKEIALTALGLLLLLYLTDRVCRWLLARWGARWDIAGLSDLASLPLVMLVLSVIGFLGTPVDNAMSRHFEHEADRYGLEVTHGIIPNPGQAAAAFFAHSEATNLLDPAPSPFIKFWLYDHPTRPERIHFAETYDPWSNGESPRYVR